MEHTFLKKFDQNTGQYYFYCKDTGETTWDIPHSSNDIILSPTSHQSTTQNNEILNKYSKYQKQKQELSDQRIILIHARKHKFRTNVQNIKNAQELENVHYLNAIWDEACRRGADNGKVRLTWKHLDDIHHHLKDFHAIFGRPLTHLFLDGNDIKSLQSITESFPYLVHLSMASNKLNDICPNIISLRQLKYLNLLRNNIKTLPLSIGNMTQLEVLELANNDIAELPDSFGNLKKLQCINLECNRLKCLPETFFALTCEVLNLNSNSLSTLPNCISSMEKLRVLTVNNNLLKYLPSNIGDSQSLNVFHASNNLLMELPESIGRITTLQKLWLDFNQLAALPYSFHKLIFLEELKMDGNFNMAFPPLQKILDGPKETLEWCRKRHACSLHAKRQNIILSVQDVLRQVGKYETKGWNGEAHSSLYERDVAFHDELLWNDSEFDNKGNITSFTFERSEVEQILARYQDASGNIIQYNHKAYFRRCSCLGEDGKKNVCIPPRLGWMCERPAMLIKMNITLERQMTEKRRKNNEIENLEMALRSARDMANTFLMCDEGILMVHKMAEKRVEEYLPKGSSLQDYKHQAPTMLGTAEGNSKEFDSWVELLRDGIDSVNELNKEKSACLKVSYCSKSQNEEIIKEVEIQLHNQYVEIEVSRRRKLVEEVNKKMKIVMKKWLGLGMEEVFLQWKSLVFDLKSQQKKDIKKRNNDENLTYENKIMQLHYAETEVKKWTPYYDVFNDIKYWLHAETGEECRVEPTVEHFLPHDWTSPFKDTSFVESGNSSNASSFDIDSTIIDSRLSNQMLGADETEIFYENEGKVSQQGKDKEILEAATRLLARRRQQLA